MSSKRQLKRKLSETEGSDSNSDFQDEVKKSFNSRIVRKKRVHLMSDSEDESAMSDQSMENKDEKSDASSDESKPLSKIANSSKQVVISSNSSDDKSLVDKIKDNTSKSVETSDDEESASEITKILKFIEKSKQICFESSDSSDDEQLKTDAKTSVSLPHSVSKKNGNNQNSGSEENNLYATSDEDETLSTLAHAAKLKKQTQEINSSVSSGSDDEPLAAIRKKSIKHSESFKKTSSFDSIDNGLSATSDIEEPVIQLKKTLKVNRKCNAIETSSESSDEEEENKNSLAIKSKKVVKHLKITKQTKIQSSESEENGLDPTTDEDEHINKIAKTLKQNTVSDEKHTSSDSSDDEPIANKISTKQKSKKEKNGVKHISSEDNKTKSSLANASKQKSNRKKTKSSSNDRIEHIKKYLRLSGIFIKSYDKLFEDCKSVKAKVEKLLAILHEKGMKGRPTIEKCKKLKLKIETKKEIAELDTANIIKSEGRPKRGEKIIQQKQDISSPPGKRFSRLKDIIDSEESD